ncbi:MAG: GHMP kinase [Deltaproteobacteria bacterium]|nr:GHMP kinase [Deltaproteobacteria bacterium]
MVSAPGRICLFGEHSDYIGLPVITMAMNLRLTISAFPRRDKKFQIIMPDIEQEELFTPSAPIRYAKERDYLRAAVNVLKRRGFQFPKGYDFFMRSQIPINSGASSSSAMVVAWLKMLLSLQNHEIEFNPIEIAKLAFETEVLEFKEAGGRMDHFAISMGELIYLENHKTTDICFLGDGIQGIVLGDSLQRKETVQNLKINKQDVFAGLKAIKKKIKKFDVEKTSVKEILKYFSPKAEPLRKAIATLKNRDITHEALREFVMRPFQNLEKIGKLMSQHHLRLRNDLKISTPKIERMIEASLSAGALGAKIHGSGLGGTMIAYAPGREKQVVKGIEREGGKPYLIYQDRGIIKHL